MKQKVFLDSSFFFPLIGIEIRACPKTAILELFGNVNIQIFRSELVIFELSAKGTKLINASKLEMNDLIEGINIIHFHPKIQVIPIFYSEIQILSSIFRKNHSDFIDCLVLASAVYYSDLLLTMDANLKEKTNRFWQNSLDKIQKDFKVVSWEEFQNEDAESENEPKLL